MKTLSTVALGLGLLALAAGSAAAQNLTLPFNVGQPQDETVVVVPRDAVAAPVRSGRSTYQTRTPAQIERYRGYEQGGE